MHESPSEERIRQAYQKLLEDVRKKKRQIEHLYLSQYRNDFIISLNRYADQMLYKAAGVCP